MNNDAITAEIIEELTTLKDTSEVSSEQVLVWAQRVIAQGIKKKVLDSTRDMKDFDLVRREREN